MTTTSRTSCGGLAEYCRELADEFGRKLIAVALCGPQSLLVLVEGHHKERRRAFRDETQYDVYIWPIAAAESDIRRGNIPVANDAIAKATAIYDPQARLAALRELAELCSTQERT